MKKTFLLFAFLFVLVPGIKNTVYAQTEPVMYFCEKYDNNDGELGIRDRFTTGHLTIMVRCDHALDLKKCSIQFERFSFRTRDFGFYKSLPFVLEPDMKYVEFSKDIAFEEPGFYRVSLLDDSGRTVASGLVEIISK